MEIKIFFWLFYSTIVAILFPIILLSINFNRQPIAIKWLVVILLFSFSCDFFCAIVLILKLPINVNRVSDIYALFNPILLSIFYFKLINWKSLKKPLIIVNALMLSFSLFTLIYSEKFNLNSLSAIPETLLVMALSIVYFYKLLRELPTQKIQTLPLFWIISAYFVTNAGKLVVYTFKEYLITIFNDSLVILYILHSILSLIWTFLLAWGAWLQYKQLKNSV